MALTLQFVPHTQIETLSSLGRIRKLLNIAKQDRIVLLEGRLTKEEEAELIKITMEEINAEFKGIELAVIYPNENLPDDMLQKVKYTFLWALMGNRLGLTIIGPANIVKEIKRDPNKIQLFTELTRRKAKKTPIRIARKVKKQKRRR